MAGLAGPALAANGAPNRPASPRTALHRDHNRPAQNRLDRKIPLRTFFSDRGRVARATGWMLLVLAIVGTVLLGLAPSPYAIERPGPVYDVLGSTDVDGKTVPLIEVSGEKTYATSGKLDMLTVYVDGSPQTQLSWIEVAGSWFDTSRAVVPLDEIFPSGQTDKQANQQSNQEMSSSQQSAQAAALTALGIDYTMTTTVTVAQTVKGTPADGTLKAGDVLTTVNGQKVVSLATLQQAIIANGTTKPVTLEITRDGAAKTLEITPTINSDTKKPSIGIYTGDSTTFGFPFHVTIQLQDVGGPSAGMMLALGIYDKLTPGALVGGKHIAGTGTIDPDGTVGAIGGIRQKLYGARDDGATWFLAPESNCNEVVGHIPSGIRVVAVKTFGDSLAAVKAIASGTGTSSLPGCSTK
ncbi:MAG: PDZ domain-containing protein [Actinomycetota bacterium]|nr:PDZ domain-containing protein [Actinomycetota bacterium]